MASDRTQIFKFEVEKTKRKRGTKGNIPKRLLKSLITASESPDPGPSMGRFLAKHLENPHFGDMVSIAAVLLLIKEAFEVTKKSKKRKRS